VAFAHLFFKAFIFHMLIGLGENKSPSVVLSLLGQRSSLHGSFGIKYVNSFY